MYGEQHTKRRRMWSPSHCRECELTLEAPSQKFRQISAYVQVSACQCSAAYGGSADGFGRRATPGFDPSLPFSLS